MVEGCVVACVGAWTRLRSIPLHTAADGPTHMRVRVALAVHAIESLRAHSIVCLSYAVLAGVRPGGRRGCFVLACHGVCRRPVAD